MLHTAMLLSDAFNANVCATLQPNSQSWQLPTNSVGLTSVSTVGFGMPGGSTSGCPSQVIMARVEVGLGLEYFETASGMGLSDQPATRQRMQEAGANAATYQDYNGIFNKLDNKGNHSRRDGWPPTSPGGGSAAS